MAEIRQILFVDSSQDRGQRSRFEKWSAWAWTETALSRWTYASVGTFEAAISTADLMIVDWSPDTSNTAQEVCRTAHRAKGKLPILITVPSAGPTEALEEFRREHVDCQVRSYQDLSEDSSLGDAIRALGVDLPVPKDIIDPDQNDVLCRQLLREMHPLLLPLTLQKYFPDAAKATVEFVGDGWSGVPLFRVSVDGDGRDYFIKFFDDRRKFEREYETHERAKVWLGPFTVGIVPVYELAPTLRAQIEAFPQRALRQPPGKPDTQYRTIYPICYESASNFENPRRTLKDLYKEKGELFIQDAYREILHILLERQLGTMRKHTAAPAADVSKRQFFRDDGRISVVLHALADLRRYGPDLEGVTIWESPRIGWRDREHSIRDLLLGEYPAWLRRNCPVKRGHIHGDPNSRNCLVAPANALDIRIIDCGDYSEDGFLVFDLAQLECDIKLVLMGNEPDRPRFGDIDATQLPEWCRVEYEALSAGLEFEPDSADKLNTENKSILRAYRLIGMVRQRARQVSDGDKEGRHYFASILFWNLKWLKLPAVRRTKKLLALYSASEILRRYEHAK